MIFDPKFDNVSVPPPLNVTFAASISNAVVFAEPFIVIEPALLIVLPLTVSDAPLAKLRLSVLDPRVRSAVTAPEIFSVTVEPAVSMQVFELLVGMPPFQLAATFQLPDEPPCQVEVHCASAVSGEKSTASIAIKRIRGPRFVVDETCS